MSVQYSRRPFSVAEYDQMVESGILREDDRVELIEGEIIAMSPIGKRHVACVNRLNRVLAELLAGKVLISVQNPIAIPDWSEPSPDIALLTPRADDYAAALALPRQILAVIEVADTSLRYDMEVKMPLYAKAGIRELWIVDLTANRILVHARPRTDGYAQVRVFQQGDRFSSQRFPGVEFAVSELIP